MIVICVHDRASPKFTWKPLATIAQAGFGILTQLVMGCSFILNSNHIKYDFNKG